MREASATAIPSRPTGLSVCDVTICLYLAVPVLFFCLWFKPLFAVVLATLTCYSAHRAVAGTRWQGWGLSRSQLTALVLLALAWVALGGAGHIFYANHDWLTRDAVLRDLSLTGWPPSYPTSQSSPLILRAPIGYYLPASLVGAMGGVRAADTALYLWTSLGFFLVLAGTLSLFETPRQRALCVGILLLFGGMDLPGHILLGRAIPSLGEHIEWWAVFAQYSSNSTLLFWVPNHAIPAWLTTLLILRNWRRPELARMAPLLGSCVPFWSPLAALGSVPFFLLGIDWRRHIKHVFAPLTFLPCAVVALVCARYLTIGAERVPGGWLFDGTYKGEAFANVYALFCIFEFGVLSLILVRLRAFGIAQIIAAVILCILPLYRFGYGNDLVMRTSVPALLVLALATIRPLASEVSTGWRGVLAGILLIGAAGALQEPIRAVLYPRWDPRGLTLPEVSERVTSESGEAALPSTYVAHLVGDLGSVMRTPSPVLATRDPQREAIPHHSAPVNE